MSLVVTAVLVLLSILPAMAVLCLFSDRASGDRWPNSLLSGCLFRVVPSLLNTLLAFLKGFVRPSLIICPSLEGALLPSFLWPLLQTLMDSFFASSFLSPSDSSEAPLPPYKINIFSVYHIAPAISWRHLGAK